jgi:hypothetical protein
MADNTTLPGTGDVIATDDVSGVKFQRVKLVDGTLDSVLVIPGDSTNGLWVNVKATVGNVVTNSGTFAVQAVCTNGGTFAVQAVCTNAGTFAVQASIASSQTIAVTNVGTFAAQAVCTNAGTFAVQAACAGDVAHDAADGGNPVKQGATAISHGTNPTAVAAADRTKLYANVAGVPFVIGGHPNIQTIKHTTITTAVTDAAIITVGAGLKIVVTSLMVTLDNASTVFPSVLIGFGVANTPTGAGVIGAHGGVPAGGGFSRGDGSGILGVGADGEDLRVTTVGNATGNGLQIVVTYYTIES